MRPRRTLARAGLCAGLLALSAALAPAPARAAPEQEGDDDFEPIQAPRSIALGPQPRGESLLSLDVGWLRSGLRFDLGFGAGIDLVVKADAWLLHDLLGSQDSIQVGFRVSPFPGDAFRASIEGTAGQLFLAGGRGLENMGTFRGELVLGGHFEPVLVYGRAALRALHDRTALRDAWVRDGEVGGGVEYAWRKLRVAAEAYAWARPEKPGLAQWRLRVAWAN